MKTSVPDLSEVLKNTPKYGTVSEVAAAAHFVGDVGQDAGQYGASVRGAAVHLLDSESFGVQRIQSKLVDRLMPGATALQQSAVSSKQAFHEYAAEIERIHTEADRVYADTRGALDAIAAAMRIVAEITVAIRASHTFHWRDVPSGTLPDPPLSESGSASDAAEQAAVAQAIRRRYEGEWLSACSQWNAALGEIDTSVLHWSRLIDERQRAEKQLVHALEDTPVGQLITLGAGTGISAKRAIAIGVSGELWGQPDSGTPYATSHPLLEKLFAGADASLHGGGSRDSQKIAVNWQSLEEHERETLITEVPWVIGNLPGLSADTRDRANRLQLEYFRKHPQALDLEQLKLAAGIQRIVNREAEQIVGRGRANPPIQVFSLDLAHEPPTCAVAYGDADSAENTTWVVPGMNNDASEGLYGLDRASGNLFREQRVFGGGRDKHAVIAWLGYDTPGRPDELDFSVLRSGKAQTGAVRLAAELDGMYEARAAAGHGRAGLDVLAHSYGTTVASIALTMTKHPADAFVMIGSAGLDTSVVKNLDLLNVREIEPGQKAIYTTHAAADQLAPAGAALGRRGQPNPNAETVFRLHEYAPLYGGALSFSSEGDHARGLAETDGHSMIGDGESPGLIGMSASEGHGYADRDTQSLESIARITMGAIDEQLRESFVRTEGAREPRVLSRFSRHATSEISEIHR